LWERLVQHLDRDHAVAVGRLGELGGQDL
jgi:hypothetical protein